MSPQEDESSMSEEQHFYLVGENWTKDETNDLVPPNRDMTWIATALEQKVDHVNCLLILLNQPLNAQRGKPQKWLDASTYKTSWRPRKLPISSKVNFKYEIHENAKERRQESTKVSVFRDTKHGLIRVEDDSNQAHDNEFRRYTLRIAFRLGEDDNSNSVQLFVRANISTARKPVNALREVLGGPVTSLLEFLGPPYWSTQSSQKSEEQVLDESLQPKVDPKVKKISKLVASASNWASSKRNQLRNWLSGKPTRSLLTASSATLIAYVVGIGIVWLRVIDNSTPSIKVQYLTFILVCFAPFAMLRLQRWIDINTKDLVDQKTQIIRLNSGHYIQSRIFLRTLIASIFGLAVYIAVPAIAWPTFNNTNAWLWLWSDRQTLGLLATLMIGVLSTIFSNSVRELTLENSEIRNEVSDKAKKLRTLTDEIHEMSHRLWSEYETHIKDFGKVFIFRANDFAHMAGRDGQEKPIDPVLKGLLAIFDTLVADDEPRRMPYAIDWLDEEYPERDWDKEPNEYFLASDFDFLQNNTKAPNLSTLEEFAKIQYDKIHSTDVDEGSARTEPENAELNAGQKLAWIVRRFVASDDGRFAVLPEKEDDFNQRLMLQRRIQAVISKFEIDDSNEGKSFKIFGYFPTDESVTLSFIQAMRKSETWLTSASGDGMDDWLRLVYSHIQEFGIDNKARFEQIEALIRKFDDLVSGMGIPTSLFLDDLILFLETMRTGTDDVLEEGEALSDQQYRTLARFLTYASVFYYVQVLFRDTKRKLLPTFPSPFRALKPVDTKSPTLDRRNHETGMFEELRKALEHSLGKMTASGEVDQSLWPCVLELSNRQGPTTNFMRASRAFITRKTFLDSKDFEMPTLEFMEVSEERGDLITKYVFNDINTAPRWRALLDPLQPQDTSEEIAVRRPVRLKVARKSSISSFCKGLGK